jgi:hypothetical protein
MQSVLAATTWQRGRNTRSKGYHWRNRLSGSARFLYFGAHFFHLDFILAQQARETMNN